MPRFIKKEEYATRRNQIIDTTLKLVYSIRIWYADENLIVRQKLSAKTLDRITPLLTEIVRQGVREGVFNTHYPEYISQVNFYLLQGLSDAFVELLYSSAEDAAAQQKAENLVAAYNDALIRILGAPGSSIQVMDQKTIAEWFTFRPAGLEVSLDTTGIDNPSGA